MPKSKNISKMWLVVGTLVSTMEPS